MDIEQNDVFQVAPLVLINAKKIDRFGYRIFSESNIFVLFNATFILSPSLLFHVYEFTCKRRLFLKVSNASPAKQRCLRVCIIPTRRRR